MKKRSSELEILDSPGITAQQINDSLKFMTIVNKFFGGTRVILDYFNSHSVPDDFTVADLGSGSGDISYALVQWAKSKGKRIKVFAFDLNPDCLSFAKEHYAIPEIEYLLCDAFKFDKTENFDYVISSMFFHHLKDDQIIKLLGLMKQNVKQGFVINDLHRSVWPWIGAYLLGLLSTKKVVIHDAKLSVARGFRISNCEQYKNASGMNSLQIKRHLIGRISMSYHV